MTVGFIDQTCPPTSVYATYNNLSIPKRIYNDLPTVTPIPPPCARQECSGAGQSESGQTRVAAGSVEYLPVEVWPKCPDVWQLSLNLVLITYHFLPISAK